MRVYLDNCCYNRPYDEQHQLLVRLESEAKLCIQQMIRDGQVELVWSDVLEYENAHNPFDERRLKIAEWEGLASVVVEMDDRILENVRGLMSCGLKQMDASHIGCAISSDADYFITVDKKVLNKTVRGICIVNPIDFIRRLLND
jgi:predicted nucleic acid-binding protein